MNSIDPSDYLLESYVFPLPQDRIAQTPPPTRGTSRLLVCSTKENTPCIHARFTDLARYLPKGALLVANNSRVLQARLKGRRKSGGAIEFLLLSPLPLVVRSATPSPDQPGWYQARAEGLLRANSRGRIGEIFSFSPTLSVEITGLGPFGHKDVLLHWQGDLAECFARIGHIPLPPYIKRPVDANDTLRYQTVYADPEKTGSVAAPTAGLHFTEEIKDALCAAGFGWTAVTLYVGYGTFSPIRTPDIRDHHMHSEYVELSKTAADTIARAQKDGRPIIAIGTTSVRALEGVYAATGTIAPFAGPTDLFLYPGRAFHVVNGLLTNFHLPGSSLLLLVSALVGRKRLLAWYDEAIAENYRFFSYGDCMLITN